MWIWNRIRRIISKNNGWNEVCVDKGHDIYKVNGKDLNVGHQKGGKRPVIEYYDGTLSQCLREGCSWESYSGSKTPFLREVLDSNGKS